MIQPSACPQWQPDTGNPSYSGLPRPTLIHHALGHDQTEPDLVEWDYGEYEGKLSAEIRQESPGWNIFEHGCPGGETPRQVSDRADRVTAQLLGRSGTTALFSHRHFGSALAVRWITLQIGAAEHFWLDTASISVLGHHPSRPQTRTLARWNIVPQSRS